MTSSFDINCELKAIKDIVCIVVTKIHNNISFLIFLKVSTMLNFEALGRTLETGNGSRVVRI